MTVDIGAGQILIGENHSDLSDSVREAAGASSRRDGYFCRDIIAIHGGANTEPTVFEAPTVENGTSYQSSGFKDVQDIFAPREVNDWVCDVKKPFQPLGHLFPAGGKQRVAEQYYEWVYDDIVVSRDAAKTSQSLTNWPPRERYFRRFAAIRIGGQPLSTRCLTSGVTVLQDSSLWKSWDWSLDRLNKRVENVFSAAREEQFEVGMESRFSRELDDLCAANPDFVLETLIEKVRNSSCEPQVIAELLQWTSRQRKTLGLDAMYLFKQGLLHGSSLVRDCAALSFADFDESRALVHLQEAARTETEVELRKDLEALVDSLRA